MRNPTALCQLCSRNRCFLWKWEAEKVPRTSAFAPVPQLKTPRTRGSARDEAALSAAFTWLWEKLWAPPVVPHPKRNRSPAGRLCRGWHRDKTRNRAVKRQWRGSDPGLLGHQWGFYYSSFVTSSKGLKGLPDHKDYPNLNATFAAWHLTLYESSSTEMLIHSHICFCCTCIF